MEVRCLDVYKRQGLKSATQFKKQGFTENTIIDVLNKASTAEWDSVAAAFPDLSSVIDSARNTLDGFNNFLGLNIANSPWYSAKQYLCLLYTSRCV